MLRRPSALLGGLSLALALSVLGGAPAGAVTPGPSPSPTPTPTPTCTPDAPKPAPERPPAANSAPAQGAYFSYPNRAAGDRVAIRQRVLNLINSTWGRYYVADNSKRVSEGPCLDANGALVANHTYLPSSGWVEHTGTIRLATWSYNDPGVHNALRNAVGRGVSVGVLAARGINAEMKYKPWTDTKALLARYPKASAGQRNFAAECSGSCRGNGGGTPHSKYYLFDDVGSAHTRNITVQTSMNLTTFAYVGQWNAGYVFYNAAVYQRFLAIFNQSVLRQVHRYESSTTGGVINSFYPGGSLTRDMAMQALGPVRCTGAKSGGINGRTRIRVIQYAIYDTRGVQLAKRLRALWNAGCNVAIIYSVTSRPVLKILRATSGRGPVPMKQSVIKNSSGEIVKYNHSKWLAISGNYAGNPGNWTVQSGSSNWSNFAYSCDESVSQVYGFGWVAPFIRTFDTTWNQSSSRKPTYGGSLDGARIGARGTAPTFGYGQFKFMEND